MSLSTKLLTWYLSGRKRALRGVLENPVRLQHSVLKRLIRSARKTRFTHDHKLAGIRDYEEYRNRVPLRSYADFAPYLQDIRDGKPDVLASGRPRYWGRTGGTTGKDKLIPIYPASIKQSKKSFELALYLHLREHPETQVFGKKFIFLGSCTSLTEEGGLPSGFMSSIMANEFSARVRKIILPGDRLNHLPDWSSKIEAIFDLTKDQDVGIIGAMPPWMCAFFRYVVERTGKPVCETWPNLKLCMHSGVAMESYREEIDRLIGNARPSFKNGYGCTEGNFAVQEKDADDNLLLWANEVFFEFVPLSSYLQGKGQEERIPLEAVKKDENYVIVMTTPGGLWSYVIGDTVRFVSVKPYRFKISGRTAQFLNLAGEKLSVEQALQAIRVGCRKTGAEVNEFTLFPRDAGGTPGHEWLVEFARQPASDVAFIDAVDRELSAMNPLYRVRRQSKFGETCLLQPPLLRGLPPGAYRRWQAKGAKEGGHYKVPRISSSKTLRRKLVNGGVS